MGLNLMKKLVENPPRRHLQLSAASESCGSAISTNRLERGERAWFPVGTTSECYEKDLYPRICEVIQNAGIDRADMYVKFYMIGKSKTSAKPTVFICCINKQSRLTATEAVVASLALRTTPKIGLRHAALPLEQPTPARSLASDIVEDFQAKSSSLTSWNGDVFAKRLTPTVGRALFRSNELDELSPWSTAGVVLRSRGDICQLTIEHKPDAVSNNDVEDLVGLDLGEVSVVTFDDSDDEDNDDEPDNADASEIDQEVLSHASKTPPPSPICASVISGTNFDEYGSSYAPSELSASIRNSFSGRDTSRDAPNTQTRPTNFLAIENKPIQRELVKVGTIETKASDGLRPELDYSLVSMAASTFGQSIFDQLNSNSFSCGQKGSEHILRKPTYESHSLTREKRIDVFRRQGVTCGVIFAGTTMLKSRGFTDFQHLYLLRLDDVVREGDCGAAIVDHDTGRVYGHIVRGCSNSSIAYAIPFHEVCHDLESRGFSLSFSSSPSQSSTSQSLSHDLIDNIIQRKTQCSYQDDSKPLKGSDHDSQSPSISRWPNMGTGPSCSVFNYRWDGRSNPGDDDEGLGSGDRDDKEDDKDQHHVESVDFWSEFYGRGDRGFSSMKAAKLRDFCSNISLDDLKSGESVPPRIVASLDDKGYVKGRCRTRQKFFTAAGLFSELLKGAPETYSRVFEDFDVDRRQVLVHIPTSNVFILTLVYRFIYGLDGWTAVALANTCSGVVAAALGEAMLNHLDFRSSLKTSFQNSRGSQSFIFEFHLPFFVWKSARAIDLRRNSKGHTLRHVIDLPFSEKSVSTDNSYGRASLHEAHISLFTCGYDTNHWTAFSFEDIYYQDDVPSSSLSEVTESFDGRTTLNKLHGELATIWDPHYYFIRVLSIRIERIKYEWLYITDHLNSKITGDVSCSSFELLCLRANAIKQMYGEIRRSNKSNLDYYDELDTLLFKMKSTLNRLLDSVATFVEQHNFVDEGQSSEISESTQDIMISLRDLREFHITLNELSSFVKSKRSQVSLLKKGFKTDFQGWY
ncbi:hypothetical protein CDEST_02326 [Colletotrichum destructivum]|uniref:Uncharacterized protein n=1 Tax=Colletotrichum destructivum TaxID=34406 RepID=A0AAX4I2H6_9PEZI|nr:hypothetical protein CDEST_02326 [Colletotrichum destructivum]